MSIVGVERRVMTLYLWHLTALGLLGVGSLSLGGLGLHSQPDTPSWWAQRPAWLVALGLTTAGLVAVFGRFEEPVTVGSRISPVLPLAEVILTATLLGILADQGLGSGDSLVGPWAIVVAAFLTLATLDRLVRRPPPAGAPGRSPRAITTKVRSPSLRSEERWRAGTRRRRST
jgi:hypothetical protein